MANNNKSGMGVPGTQQTAQRNLVSGGINPNMPAGQQLARQGASSYQQSIVPGGPTPGVEYARTAFPGPSPAPAGQQSSPLAGFPYKEGLGMNASLGFSNVAPAAAPGYVPPGGDLESDWLAGNFVGFSEDEDDDPVYFPTRDDPTFGPPSGASRLLSAKAKKDTESYGGDGGQQTTPPAEVPVGEELPWSEQAEREYWQTYGETYPGEAMEDVPGVDPETLAEIEQDFIDHAEMSIQAGLAALSRQYANMGMGGSGSHMVANNALVADVYKQLQDQQNALATWNLEQIELDIQERIDNARNLMLDSAIVDAQKVSSFAEILGVSDSAIMQTFISALEDQGKVFGPDEYNALMNAAITLAQSGGEDISGIAALMEEMGESVDYFAQGEGGVLTLANQKSVKQWKAAETSQGYPTLVPEFWGLIAADAANAGLSQADVFEILFGAMSPDGDPWEYGESPVGSMIEEEAYQDDPFDQGPFKWKLW